MNNEDLKCLEKRGLIPKRTSVTLWDCGCLSWKENKKFVHLPCGQKECNVTKIVLEESLARKNEIVTLKVIET